MKKDERIYNRWLHDEPFTPGFDGTLIISEPEHGCCHAVGVYRLKSGVEKNGERYERGELVAEFIDEGDAKEYLEWVVNA